MIKITMKLVKVHKTLLEYREIGEDGNPTDKYTTISPMYLRQKAFPDDPPLAFNVTLDPIL